MSWVGIAILLLALYLAFKVAGVLLKLLLWAVVLAAAYWLLASLLGWPTLF
jgi:hypothetical protein